MYPRAAVVFSGVDICFCGVLYQGIVGVVMDVVLLVMGWECGEKVMVVMAVLRSVNGALWNVSVEQSGKHTPAQQASRSVKEQVWCGKGID